MKWKTAGAFLGLSALLAGAGYWMRESKAADAVRFAWSRDSLCPLRQVWLRVTEYRETAALIDQAIEAERIVATDGGLELVETTQGRYWIPRRNHAVMAEMVVDRGRGVYESGTHGVQNGDVVLDCGANVGVFTRHALDRGARLVVAVEISPQNLECLRRNFAAEIKAGRVIVYPNGVWDREEERDLRIYEDQSGGDSVALQFPGSRPGPRVRLTTIDILAAELKLDRVDFIKMDVEGAERKALAGARLTVEKHRPRMSIALEHELADREETPRLVRTLWPDAQLDYGPCVCVETEFVRRLQPEVLMTHFSKGTGI
ncbi:MAG: FkbM family methyltransferase [Bryobacteraceae bacterium]